MDPPLAPGDLLRLADGLEMLNGVAQFPAPLLQGLVLPGQQRHRVPSLRNIVGGEQDAGSAAHGDGVGSNAPYGGIGQAEHLLIPQRLPDTAVLELPILQIPLEFQTAAKRLPGELPGQSVHPAVAQQNISRPSEEQQSGMQGVDGLLNGDGGDAGIEFPPANQADMDAAQQEIQKCCQEKEGIGGSGDRLC